MLALLALLASFLSASVTIERGAAARAFGPELAALAREVACDGSAAPVVAAPTDDERARAAVVERHCRQLAEHLAEHRARWRELASAFFRALVPADAPRRVVYPFGGADLMTALVVFPAADEITILGLEEGGDARALAKLTPADLEVDLEMFRAFFDHLLDWSWSRTLDLDRVKSEPLPSEVAFDVLGLVTLGYQPLSLRYFELAPNGAIDYLDDGDVAAIDQRLAGAGRVSAGARSRARAEAFASFELTFRRRDDARAPTQVFRHVHADLDDAHLARDDRAVRHLAGKGQVAVLVKAASYLLWWHNFDRIRAWLVDHLAWMVSDSTGVPPSLLDATRFEQAAFGRFDATFIPAASPSAEGSLRALFASQPARPLDFPFGYPAKDGSPHLIVTRRR